MIKLKNILSEGIEAAYLLKKDAEVKFNKKPTGGPVGSLQFASQGYIKFLKVHSLLVYLVDYLQLT